MTLEEAKALGAFIAFLVALYQYKKAQQWKKHEYFVSQIQMFKADPDVQLSLQMLDWNERELTLPDKSTYCIEPKTFRKIICDEETSNSTKFNKTEAELRDAFGKFLSWLDKFGADLKAGVVDKETLDLYLGYWLKRLSYPDHRFHNKLNEASSAKTDVSELAKFHCIQKFVDDYGYTELRNLLALLEYEASDNERETAKQAFEALQPKKQSEKDAK